MFGKQGKKKKVEDVPVETPVEEEPTVDLVVEEKAVETKPVVEEKIISPADKIKQLEKELQDAKDAEVKEPEDFMTVKGLELIGQGIYQYTLITTKPVWDVGTVLKI